MREYYGKTLFEIDLELRGHNRRWEEAWRRERIHVVQRYNMNVKPGHQKKDYQLMPLPSDRKELSEGDELIRKLEAEVAADLARDGKLDLF